ncbi:MAG: hypothetical protein K4571_17925, partial [Deltaproteobacteria bacterium]
RFSKNWRRKAKASTPNSRIRITPPGAHFASGGTFYFFGQRAFRVAMPAAFGITGGFNKTENQT